MKCWKLTDQNGVTKNDTQWGINASHETSGEGELCSSGWLHAYEDPILGLLLNPIHANFASPRLWEAEADGKIEKDGQLKFGCTKLTTVKEHRVPEITMEMKIRFAILVAMEVCKDEKWTAWAQRWLDGSDRSREAANDAWYAANAAWYAADTAWRAANVAKYAADAAKYAADAAKYAANAAKYASEYGAKYTACYAANAADVARCAADAVNSSINLVTIAHKAAGLT
jgi:hypothetical protein